MYRSFKDLAFVARKNGQNMKIYQDALRLDIFAKVKDLDTREKLGFLQLQALVGLTKFDAKDKQGRPLTLETDSHGIIRNTFQKLNELGYLQNYHETQIRDSRLILPKLAFANTDLKSKVPMYNITFEKTDKEINFDESEFQRMFPLVFSKRGLLAKQGYTLERDEEGRIRINYKKREQKEESKENLNRRDIREEVKVDISQEEQKEFVKSFKKSENQRQITTKEQENEL